MENINKNNLNFSFTFNIPKSKNNSTNSHLINNSEERVEISVDDVIPKGFDLEKLIGNEIEKNNNTKKTNKVEFQLNNNIKTMEKPFLSNNQKYAKKEEIEYSKKSHLEYIKIMNQNKDPIGVLARGGLRMITMEEVRQHNKPESMWTILNGNVYDLTMYLDYHPGGSKKLLMGAGNDCTHLFNKYHSWVNVNMLIGKLQIGRLINDIELKDESK